MSTLKEIKNSFDKYINIYEGLIMPENNAYDECYSLDRITNIALNNQIYTAELCKIIIDHLKYDDIKYKIKLFYIIDTLFRIVGKDYIDKLSKYLYEYFKDCFNSGDLNERNILFKIFYTWKYLIPENIYEKIRIDLNLDIFKEFFKKENPGKIEKYDEYNEKKKIERDRMNNIIINNNNNNIMPNIILSKNKINNNQNNNNNNKKIIIEKKFKEDNYKNETTPKNIIINNIKNKTKKSSNKNMIGKKRKSSQEKVTNGNLSTKKIKTSSNSMNKNLNSIISLDNSKNININNNSTNDIITNQNNINNQALNILLQSGINLNNLTNNIPNINLPQNNISNLMPQNQQQQLIQNILLNMMPLFPSGNQNQIKPSIIEYNIYNFIQNTNTKLNINLRFFSSLSKFYNEVLQKRDIIDIKCKYEDIYNNDEYKLIKQKVDGKLFKDIKKNICVICGFRTLFYNDLTKHLDIHFNINFLQMEGKNIFRKIGHNRNNWINGDINNKNNKNQIGYTLGNLLYYKNMMNNNLIKINKEQEENNEEFMYPIDEDNKEKCYFCGDEFKKIFSSKYHYWFYNKVVKIKEEKKKILVHQDCYDELVKKV